MLIDQSAVQALTVFKHNVTIRNYIGTMANHCTCANILSLRHATSKKTSSRYLAVMEGTEDTFELFAPVTTDEWLQKKGTLIHKSNSHETEKKKLTRNAEVQKCNIEILEKTT